MMMRNSIYAINTTCPICGCDEILVTPPEKQTWNHPYCPAVAECQGCGHKLKEYEIPEDDDEGPEGGFPSEDC